MKRLLNTLYVTTPGAYLARDGETVDVRVERESKLRLPLHTLGGIVCFGQVSCSPPLMQLCAEHGVAISFFSEHGRFFARVQGEVSGNVLLRREQYRRADCATGSTGIAHAIVAAKIMNCRTVLLRAQRDYPDSEGAPALAQAARQLATVLAHLRDLSASREPARTAVGAANTKIESLISSGNDAGSTSNPLENSPEDGSQPCDLRTLLDVIRGREGEAGSIYFGVFDHLITAQRNSFTFRERTRRPPLDSVNCLLSFLYSLLAHDVAAALEGVGLDPQVGFLHRDRPGRSSLALDLMEELRPVLADRLALSLINRQQVQPAGFKTGETGGVAMEDSTRKEVLTAWQKRKQEEITHPFLGEKIPLGLLPHIQSLLLARHLRGDLDGYPPFLWK